MANKTTNQKSYAHFFLNFVSDMSESQANTQLIVCRYKAQFPGSGKIKVDAYTNRVKDKFKYSCPVLVTNA